MVNSKYVAFKVDKQAPTRAAPPQPYSTVINCRKLSAKQAAKQAAKKEELKIQQVPLTKVPGASEKEKWRREEEKKRKRSVGDVTGHSGGGDGCEQSKKFMIAHEDSPAISSTSSSCPSNQSTLRTQNYQYRTPKFRKGKTLTKGIDLDCWFTILRFSDPAQLLEMRGKIASCYRFLRDNPTLWKHSRSYYYGDDLPDPPSEITEFQYAHLRHGHGCMSCGTSNTRKTYWAFLRRWCKSCLQEKVIKEQDARALFKDANGEDISFISKCLPSGIFDSWGNFVGVGPAHTHALKTVYLKADVENLVAEFIKESRENYVSWHAEMRTWVANKAQVIDERREFARKMEHWEDMTRTSKSYDYQEKKNARKWYFKEKASKLNPPIAWQVMQVCPSFRRAIAIPKEPNMTSWLQLKPKLEKEAIEFKAKAVQLQHLLSLRSAYGDSTSSSSMSPTGSTES